MKLISFGLVCLLSTLAWAADEPQDVEEEQTVDEISEQYEDLQPMTIAFPTYQDDTIAIFTADKLTWFQASLVCNSYDYTLMSLDTLAEQTLFRTAIMSAKLQYTEPIWIGGSNLALGSVYSWYGTGAPITNINKIGTNPSTSTRCVAVNPISQAWTLNDCGQKRGFVCRCIDE